MFLKGEKVVCGSKGVCSVEDITTLNISGIDKERKYYILKPLYMAASTVYVPVDATEKSLRRVLTAQEAETLIDNIVELTPITVLNEKLIEQEYKNCLKTDLSIEWARIIITIHQRMQKRLEAGRKVTAIDTRYLKIAQDCLYGELAVALTLPREEIETDVESRIQTHMLVGSN